MDTALNDHNPYIFGDPEVDRQRLETQTGLYRAYLQSHARAYIGDMVASILDLGCGEGQLGFALREIYPAARLVGIDRDPKAIERARERAAELGLTNVEFVVGDVQQNLPDEQFDLIYAAFVFLHTRQPEKVVQLCYAALQPGGYLWVKDGDPLAEVASADQDYTSLLKVVSATMLKIGAHPYVAAELPAMLTDSGFINLQTQRESYPLGGNTPAGRATLASILGAVYNGRAVMSKFSGVPEAELVQRYVNVINRAVANEREIGVVPSLNIIARKPTAQADKEGA